MKIVVIGGGAAGMMAAASASEKNKFAEIILIERNEKLGRKVVLSGGGRCNLTTSIKDIRELMNNYPRGNRWLKYAMYNFSPVDCYEYFESNGIALKIEGKRVFPKSDNGEDIVDMFMKKFSQNKIKIMNKKIVQSVLKKKEEFIIKLSDGSLVNADKLIITTGGNAYAKTGSKGDGYKFAKELGHTVTKLVPTLTSFISKDKFIKSLAGVSVQDVSCKLIAQKTYNFRGPLLFTHKGVTGPTVFALSAYSAYENFENGTKLYIDFVPDLNQEKLKDELKNSSSKYFIHSIAKYATKSLAEAFGVDKQKKMAETSKKDINHAIECLKNFEINISGRTPGREIVTAGGVDLNEIDKKTMESKIVPGLYFAGEILDTDGLTGGFNLQNAWATGKLAGESAAKALTHSLKQE